LPLPIVKSPLVSERFLGSPPILVNSLISKELAERESALNMALVN